MKGIPSFALTTLALLLFHNTVAALDYLNLPQYNNGSSTYDVIGYGIAGSYAYPDEANMTLINDPATGFLNAAGILRLANAVADNAANITKVKRQEVIETYVGNILNSVGVDVDVSSVLQAADEPIGSSGNLSILSLSKRDDDAVGRCLLGDGYVADVIRAASRKISNTFSFVNHEYWWSQTWKITGTIADLTGIASAITGWIQNGSQKTYCDGFLYVRYDDSNNANNYHLWLIAGAPWTTGSHCDTTANSNTITEGVKEALLDDSARSISGVCTRLNNGGTWNCDLRIILAEMAAKCGLDVWSMSCINF